MQTIARFTSFVQTFRIGESYVYRDRLRANVLRKEWTLEVDTSHVIGWDEDLAARLRSEPTDLIPLVRCSLFDASEGCS